MSTEDETFRRLKKSDFIVVLGAGLRVMNKKPMTYEEMFTYKWNQDPDYLACLEEHGWTYDELHEILSQHLKRI